MVSEEGHIHATGYDDRVVTDEPFEGDERVYGCDPFGERIESMEPKASPR
jgi:hypothetical protein